MGRLKEVFKIVAYFVGVVLLGAVLAPLLYWGAHAIEPWALANGFLRWEAPTPGGPIVIRGPLSFLQADFQKYFNRAMLIAAVALIWPTLRWLRVSRADLRLRPDFRRWQHLRYGFIVGGGLVALMAGAYLFLGIYHLKASPPWGALAKIALSAAIVSVLEECLFRGAIFGLFAKAMRPLMALFWTTAIFAILHFLKPDDDVVVKSVSWLSGFALLPHAFHQFADPRMLLAGFSTMFVLGWLLGYARLRTEALWMSIGLHAGVVFVKMGFSKLTKRDLELLPWVGPELQIGLVPVALLLFGLYLVKRRLDFEELLPNPKPSER
jgi:membrane protease YdiL (CAAX protease family)